MAGDEAVLADHHRKMHPRILRDRIRLNIVVISLLVVFRIDLDPPGVARAHAVGMITVDIDRSGQRPVHERQHNGQAVTGRKKEFFPHQSQPGGAGRCHGPCSRRLSTDGCRHCGMFAFHRNKLGVDLSVGNEIRYHLRNLRRRCNGKGRHDIRVDLTDGFRHGFIS